MAISLRCTAAARTAAQVNSRMKQWMSFISKVYFLLLLSACLLYPIGCNLSEELDNNQKIIVAVTIAPQKEFVEAIGGDRVEALLMVPPGASPHTYEPTPGQLSKLEKAKVYAKVGSGVEFELAWLDNLLSLNTDMLVVDCSRDIALQKITAPHIEDHQNDQNGNLDPHIWLSPANARIMAGNITQGLIQVDPANKSYYEDNRDEYLSRLIALENEINDSLSSITTRIFMVYHPAWGYFASSFNLTMIPVEEEGKTPTPAGLAHLIDQAKEYKIKIVFVSPQYSIQSAEVIAAEIGGTVVLIDPLAEDYIDNLRSVAAEMAKVM